MHFHVLVGEEEREKMIARLEEKGVECGPHRSKAMKIVITEKEFNDNKDLLQEVLNIAAN